MAVLRSVLVGVLLFYCQEPLAEAETGDTLFFKNDVVPNHGIVTLEDVGTGASSALQCQTTALDCCTDNNTHTGDWRFPNGTTVPTAGSIYQVKGPGSVHLHRLTGRVEGVYYCEITNGSNYTAFYYVGLYSIGNGAPVISNEIQFSILTSLNAVTPMFILNCTSTGGPATTVNWISPVGGSESQYIIDTETATYSNTLTVTGREPGNYQCIVSNARNSDIQSLRVEAAGKPSNVSAEQSGSAITVSWTPPPTTPTGYLIYYQTRDDNSGKIMINNDSSSKQILSGIEADRVYYITVIALSIHLPSASSDPEMALRKEAYMVLNDRIIPNHGLVFYSNIGRTAETSLRCVTRRMDCCSGGTGQGNDEAIANWFHARGGSTGHQAYIRSRTGEGEEFGYVNLMQKTRLSREGIFHCIIPQSGSDSSPTISTFYVGIYNTGGGSLNIPYQIHFNYSSTSALDCSTPVFTLTCVSVGGPATSVIWTLNGSPIAEDSSHVYSQNVMNTLSSVYNNTLTVIGGGEEGQYQCTVANTVSSSSAVFRGEVPSSPEFMSLSMVDTTSVHAHWSHGEYEDIPLLKYQLSFARASELSYNMGYRCEFEHSGTICIMANSTATEYTITGLEEYGTYIISIAAVNVFGTSQSSNQYITTSSSAPTGAPQGLQPIATTDTSITIQWGPVECTEQNSWITHYVVKYVHGPTDGSAGSSMSTSKTVYGAPEDGGVHTYVIWGLSLGVQYFIQVAAMNDNGETGPFSEPIIAETISQCHCSCQSESQVGALIGVGVGCGVGVALLYSAVLGITAILRKKTRSIEMKECVVYNKTKVEQPKSANEELYDTVT